ncbi:MAG TPA: PfkB family carbohydrate kinase [Candidatus Limnocylindria bacterium]|nr:PfkB family carbohydrate kinase [Candidatus Limnocylindria bacterium]
MAVRFLAIGHVTRDEFAGESGWRLGGTVTYTAATASRLGARAALVTRVARRERETLDERCRALGIELHARDAEVTTTFGFRYEDGRRILTLRARSRGLTLADVPSELRSPDAVVLGSVAHEIDRSLLGAFGGAAVVVTAQGYLREWTADGSIHPRRWEDVGAVAAAASAIVLSEEDVAGDLGEPRRWASLRAQGTLPLHTPVILTFAERGSLVLADGREEMVPAYRAARVVDQTGAGDAFAAGLAVALAEGRPLIEAVRFAHAVASFAVEGVGTDGLADRATVEARMREQGGGR